jgi:methylated-DNA-[protein]-cysteine S-methyltransferase
MYYSVFQVNSGYVALAADSKGLVEMLLPVENNNDAENTIRRSFPEAHESNVGIMKDARELIRAYFKGIETRFNKLPLDLSGMSVFTQRALTAASGIPYGQVRTYRWLAGEIDEPEAARAVGNALNKNPLPVIIPCHRIIQSNGEIGGFSSGIQWKMRLLKIEKILK